MPARDPYEKLIRFYDGAFGMLPNRDEFKTAVKEALTEEELQIVLMVPERGISYTALEKKAERAGFTPVRLHAIIDALRPQGFVAVYERPHGDGIFGQGYGMLAGLPFTKEKESGEVVVRLGILIITEIQARRSEDDAMRRAAANWMYTMMTDAGRSIPTKTPYKRVLAAEEALPEQPASGQVTGDGGARILVNEPIADTRTVLPLDMISEMMRKEEVIAVAECYCRHTKAYMGEGCDCPMETCFYFDEIALMQLSTGRARRIDHNEAMRILEACEDAGLVHTADNDGDRLGVMCNCCKHACPILQSMRFGGVNLGAPSRFVINHDAETCIACGACAKICPMDALVMGDGGLTVDQDRCIGCGVCIRKCPTDSLQLVPREDQPRLYKSTGSLNRRIAAEALVGLTKERLTRHKEA